jgi:hypothetical protein
MMMFLSDKGGNMNHKTNEIWEETNEDATIWKVQLSIGSVARKTKKECEDLLLATIMFGEMKALMLSF